MARKPSRETVSTKQQRIAKLARQIDAPLTSVSHHIDAEWLEEAYRRTRKDGAVGVDGATAAQYAENLQGNLQALLNRAKDGDSYRAPPVRRVYIPKGDGKQRPIGIPTFEDKVLQRAVVMALEPIYEQQFYDCSYGFRPRRGAQNALDGLWQALMSLRGGWVLEADIKAFFDSVDKTKLQEVVRQRIRDGVIVRLIGKWLNAGVMEEGCVYHPEAGTPQGGVISPVLANIFLHEVVDQWFEQQVKPRMRGRAVLVRYADDFVMVFEHKQDARRVREVLPKRLEKYGLQLHPDKTRLVKFRQPNKWDPPAQVAKGRTSFSFLGFTHYWGQTRKGGWAVKVKTDKKRMSRALRRMSQWCRAHRHDPIRVQHKALTLKLKGHYGYYGRTGNYPLLWAFFNMTTRLWKKWLSRRSNSRRRRRTDWERMKGILQRYPLPRPRVVNSSLT